MTNTSDILNADTSDNAPDVSVSKIRVVQTASSLARSLGGPSRSITGLCEHLARAGCKVDLCSIDTVASLGDAVEVDTSLLDLHLANLGGKLSSIFIPAPFRDMLRARAAQCDIVHSHGLWEPVNRCCSIVAKRLDRPHVISIRGMLDPPSFGHAAWKKRLAMALFARENVDAAACIHTTAPLETQNVRRFGFTGPIAIIPNGLDVSKYGQLSTDDAKAQLAAQWPETEGKKILLFLSRVHPQKGTRDLVEAWAQLWERFADWHLVLAGPAQEGHGEQLAEGLRRSGVSSSVTFTGPVYGADKTKLYSAADLFVLPSISENFGIVVAEALASNVPVVTTTGTPWAELPEHKCGWQIELGLKPLKAALSEAMSLSDSDRCEMGANGRQLIESSYSWNTIAAKTVALYNWLLDRAPMPDCVNLD